MIPGLFVFTRPMATRLLEQPQQHDATLSLAEVAPVDLEAAGHRLEAFPELIQALGAASLAVRGELAKEINDVLIAMRFPGHESEESELVMEALASKVLHELVDPLGRSCRKEAVETMMAAGFPHALLLEPEDIAFAREYRPPQPIVEDPNVLRRWEEIARAYRRIAATVIVATQLLTAGAMVWQGQATVGAWVAMTFALLSATFLSFRLATVRPRELNLAPLGTLGFFALLVTLMVAAFAKVLVAGVAGAGIAVGLYLALAQSAALRSGLPKPGDWDYDPESPW